MRDIEQVLGELTLEEKAALCAGRGFWYTVAIGRLDIPPLMLTDGPHGLRKEVGTAGTGLVPSKLATCFPTAACLAASWDRALVAEVGAAIAREALAQGVSVVLGPGANIKRSPLCGRNFEYFSEDPYLSGQLATAWINGLQSRGVGAALKHFAANNQETRRMSIDARVDERALREIYLAGFEAAVKQGNPWTVMAAYNRLNGEYCCEHPTLLGGILRAEWGYAGLVMSDWGAVNDRVHGLRAGLDLEMPGVPNGNFEQIIAAVQENRLDELVLDRSVGRVLQLARRADAARKQDRRCNPAAQHALARRAAAEGAVLLKNEGHLLPLKRKASVALIGAFARQPRYQGAGSSLINPTRLENLHDELLRLAAPQQLAYAPGYSLDGGAGSAELLSQAVDLAGKTDAAVVCVGLPDIAEVEGLDRAHMKLPRAHDELVEAVACANPRTVVVLSNGAPVEMPWVKHVPAILEGYLGGQAGGSALADILYGRANPCGKLAETFPITLEDHPSCGHFPGGPRIVEYRESIYVGYRYFDSATVEPLFPFGHGLSYTQFSYSSLRLSRRRLTAGEPLRASLRVRNTGRRRGKEIVQLYVRAPQSRVFRAYQELKGFEKIDLRPGEEREVVFNLDARAFAYYDAGQRCWQVLPGRYEIRAAASSRDIRLCAQVELLPAKGQPRVQVSRRYMGGYLSAGGRFSRARFAALLDEPLPDNLMEQPGAYTLNTPISDMRASLIGRFLARAVSRQVKKLTAGFEDTPQALMMRKMVAEGPLRVLLMSSDGGLSPALLEALLALANRRIARGLITLLQAFRARR